MINTVKMKDLKFDPSLFEPMKTGRAIDHHFSSEGGIMRGTNYAIVGDPGVGKTTVMMDIIADMHNSGKKVLFISGEMNSIDMYGYVTRFPKFGDLPILFMGDYIEQDCLKTLESILSQGWDAVLIDSMAEIVNAVVDSSKKYMSSKKAETDILNLFEKHNKGDNSGKVNTCFLVIQQVTKQGNFAGSNRFKHMMTGMAHMKFSDGNRIFYFSKNRRGGIHDGRFFTLGQGGRIGWQGTVPLNEMV
mgnify:CR=1 FL=1|tara:strand:+ start:38 stop:775 length:738 start_codon:yes stop_codon:yes gene_type:complete